MAGEEKPDYARCVSIVAEASLKAMIKPGLLAVIGPVAVGVTFKLVGLATAQELLGAKAMAGLSSIILDNPLSGTTFGVSRTVNSWWRNRAATAAYAAAGGQGAITSSPTNGGALIEFLENEWVQLNRYVQGGTKIMMFAGSDFISAYKREIRANGYYSQTGFSGNQDGGMGDIGFKGVSIQYDPTMDNLNLSKRCYVVDMGRTGLRLMYMDGQRLKKHNPARPYDRYVMYAGLTMTGVMICKQLNTSAVYDIT
jgi:hypothetical protein